MSVTLNLYGTHTAATTLTNACTFVTVTGGGLTSRNTSIGKKSGYGEVQSQAGGTWPATTQSTIGAPDGGGWLYDTVALESAQIVAGAWTASVQLAENSSGNFVGDLYCRFYVYNSNTLAYTSIGQASQTGIAFSQTQTVYTLTSGALSAVTFGTGDKLYVDVWINVTTASTNTNQGAQIRMASSSTQGVANAMEIDTPGVQFVRTIPCTAALSAQRTIPCTASLALPSGVRVILASAALLQTSSRTLTCDSALQATFTRTISPVTAALFVPDNTRTLPCTGALSLSQTIVIPCSCSLGGGIIRTIPASAALTLTQTRIIGCTASLAWPPFTRFPTVSRRTGTFPFTGRRTGLFPQRNRRES